MPLDPELQANIDHELLTRFPGDYIMHNGMIFSTPSFDEELGEIAFYEPIECHSQINGNMEFMVGCASGLDTVRVIGNMYGANALNNATFEYHEIELEQWPNLRVFKSTKNAQNSYNRVRRDAEKLLIVPGKRTVVELPIEPFLQSINLQEAGDIDLCMLRAINGVRDDPQAVLHTYELRFDGLLYASFATLQKDDTLFSYFIKLEEDAVASVATWHLIDYAHVYLPQVKYFDMWNVAVTTQEMYKRAFFTRRAAAPCYYRGANPYSWLTVSEGFHDA